MAKKHQEGEPEENLDRWLLTYSDLITLLLLFFIIMYVLSTIDKGRIQELAEAISAQFSRPLTIFEGGAAPKSSLPLMQKPFDTRKYKRTLIPTLPGITIPRNLKDTVIAAIKPEVDSRKVNVYEDERGLVITLTGDVYFDSGSARLKNAAKNVLNKVADVIKIVPNFVRIEGHTDSRQVSPMGYTEGYETNWELASARSINVVRYFIEEKAINPKQLSAVTFGQYRPIDENNTPEGRSYNRRVDIVILKDKWIEEGGTKGISRPLPDEEWR